MLARMHAELDRLGALDLDTVDDDELHDVVVGLQVSARLAGFGARCTTAWDGRRVWANDGSKSPVARLAHDAHLSHRDTRLAVTRARRLRHLAATADALCAGTVTAGHADALASVVNPQRADVFARDEDMLIDHARTLSFPDFRRALAYWTQRADAGGVEADALRIRDGRYVDAARTFAGTVDLRGELDPVDGTIVLDELERLEQTEFEHDWRVARDAHGERATADQLARTPRQRRADALVTMARRSAAMPADHGPARPLITVLVDYPSFAGPVRELADGTVLSPGQIVALLTEADIERVVFDGPSRVLDVGVRRRLFTGATRRAVEVRDRHCTHPGCHEPAHRCHVDHIQPWSQGGPTTQQNGRLLCPVHNRRRTDQPDHADARSP